MASRTRPHHSRWYLPLSLMIFGYVLLVPVNLLLGDIKAAIVSAVLAPICWWVRTKV